MSNKFVLDLFEFWHFILNVIFYTVPPNFYTAPPFNYFWQLKLSSVY